MQKKRLAIIILLPWIFHSFYVLAQETPPALIITEIAAFEPSETEWIEIYNKSETQIDVTGWKFFEDGTNHGLSAFMGDFLLDPNEYAVIANKADLVAQKYPEFTGTLFDSSWSSLKEEGEEIGIKDANGNFLERFTYPQIGSSTSLERIDNALSSAEPTNWAPHQTSHSMGRAREIPAISGLIETGTSTELASGSSTLPAGSSEPQPQPPPPQPPQPPPPPPPPPPPSPPSSSLPTSANLSSNLPPQAVIQIQSGSLIAQGETTINFDGRASFDPDGNRLNFFWDFGDGTTSNSENPGSHKYSTPGFYTVSLTVTDPAGASGKNYQYVQVLNKPALSAPPPITQPPPVPTPQQSPAALAPSSSIFQQLSSLENFPQGTMELRGYFVFAIPSTPAATAPLKNRPKMPRRNIKATEKSQKKAKKTAALKPIFKNGDLSTDIKITEIFPYPALASQEWIEVQNTGNKTVNLGNWMLADLKKTSSPYLVPDSMNLKPGAYAVFQKNATRISLNNNSDTVFLADFEGNVIDFVSYTDAKKDFSYALIRMTDGSDLVASAQPLPLREDGENLWEWINQPTPGDKNPVFEKIEGRVSKLLAGGDAEENLSFDVVAPDGQSKKIRFNEEMLDPLTAEIIMKEGADVSVQAEKGIDGSYALKNIDDVRPAPEQNAADDAAKNSTILWIAIGVLALSFLFNGIPLLLALKRWLASREARLSETTGFQKDETEKPETKSDQRRFY